MPRIVCVDCSMYYRPEENGVLYEETANGMPYKLWHADKWKCPGCGHEIIAGEGHGPIAEHFQEGYAALAADALLRTLD